MFRKYLLLILLPVTIAILASSAISLHFAYEEIRSGFANLQHEKARAAASAIEQSIMQIVQRLGAAGRQRDVELQRVEFLNLLRQTPAVRDIVKSSSSENAQLYVPRGLLRGYGDTRFAEVAIRDSKCDQPWLGTVYFRAEPSYPHTTVAMRSCGISASVTAAAIDLEFISGFISHIKIGDKGKVSIVDTSGLLVADPDPGLVLRRTNLRELAHVKAASETRDAPQSAMLSRDLAGTPILVSFAPIESLEWNVFVEQPMSELYEKLNASLVRATLLLLVGLVTSMVAALALAHRAGTSDSDQRLGGP